MPPPAPMIDPMVAQRPLEAPERRGPIAAAPPRDAEADDPLRAPRGIILGIALALIGFWLPLSIAAWRFLR